jgi:hypothetical protein
MCQRVALDLRRQASEGSSGALRALAVEDGIEPAQASRQLDRQRRTGGGWTIGQHLPGVAKELEESPVGGDEAAAHLEIEFARRLEVANFAAAQEQLEGRQPQAGVVG